MFKRKEIFADLDWHEEWLGKNDENIKKMENELCKLTLRFNALVKHLDLEEGVCYPSLGCHLGYVPTKEIRRQQFEQLKKEFDPTKEKEE